MEIDKTELYYSYVEELEEKFFRNRVAGTLQFGVSHEELSKTYIYADTYMKAVAEAASNQGYQLEEFWQDNMSKNVVFKFIYVGDPRNCETCGDFPGDGKKCKTLDAFTSKRGQCSEWGKTPKNKKVQVFCEYCKQEIKE